MSKPKTPVATVVAYSRLAFTPQVAAMILGGAPVVLSVSGGKDSDAMVWEVLYWLAARGLSNKCYLVHADLGRAELKATPKHVEELAAITGLPLHVVRHSKFDLLDGIRNRMKVRPEVPPWPSAKNRQCTSDWKRGPISVWLRNTFPTGDVVCAIGMRGEESAARAKRPVAKDRDDCCSQARHVVDWLPLHHMRKDGLGGVWHALEGKAHHPAYDSIGGRPGNDRVSCAMCILANEDDLLNGALQDPELFQSYCDVEVQSGFSFRQGLWLGSLAPQLLRADQVAFYEAKEAA